MFSSAQYQSMYDRFLGPLSQKVGIRLNNGTGFDPEILVDAHVSKYREQELVNDGPVMIGDLKLIIVYESLPVGMRDLEIKDRIVIDGRSYAVVRYDRHTRTVGDVVVAVEVTVRG
jgi:hypothetical protein